MSTRNTFASLTNTISQTLENFWDSAKNYLAEEPTPLWQKAMEEPGYQAYRQFKSDLAYQSEIALQTIVSPYAVIVSEHTTDFQKEAVRHLLCSNPESAVNYFYDDVMNHLVELSYDNSTIEGFTSMLAFYKPYVAEEVYQTVIQHQQAIDKANPNLQSRIIDVAKKINHAFKAFQIDMNLEEEQEQKAKNAAQENHEQHHRPNFNQLILMGAISLLANKHHLGLGLGLAITTLFAEPVDAALPTVANPIPTQYAEVGQSFSYNIDLNHVFNDADGDIMTFGGVTMTDGSPLPNWLTAKPIKLSGRDYANDAHNVEVVGNLAYVANGAFGLLIFNISNPNQKVFISSFDTPGNALGIAVENGVAYVADDTEGLQLINVSNPSNPSLLASYYLPGSAQDVTVLNQTVYVANYDFGLQLINVTDANNPTLLSNYNTGLAQGIAVQNGVAYVAGGSSLQLLNVSNLLNLTLLGSYATTGNAYSVTVQNEVAYIAYTTLGLLLINISNVSNPILLSRYATSGSSLSVAVQNGVAYLVEQFLGIHFINVSNVSKLTLLSSYFMFDAWGITVQNNVAYIANYHSDFQLLNVTDASNPKVFSEILGNSVKIMLQNEVAYVVDGITDFQVINISNASNPTLLSRITMPFGFTQSVAVQNGVAYVTDESRDLQLINVSNVTNLTLLGVIYMPGSATEVTVQNEVAYVADGSSGLQIINVSNASNPRLLSNYDTPGRAQDVLVQNGVAYVSDWTSGFQLINVTNSSKPTFLANYSTPGYAKSAAVQNGVAYVADWTSGLQLINVSNPGNLTLLGRYDTPGSASAVAVQNGIAYVADYDVGLQLINVSNTSNPTLLSSVPGVASDISVQNNIAYVADAMFGLQILGLSCARLTGILPLTANGSYYFRVHATNNNSEWISTDMELRMNISQFSAMSTASPMPVTSSSITAFSISPSTNALASQSSNPIQFTITVSSTPILIEGGSITLTPNYLTITGNIDPNEVVYTVQGSNPNFVITVNGVEVTQFTQGDVERRFVVIESQGTGCQDYDNNLQLRANVAGSSTTVDFSLILQQTTLSCNAGSRLRDTAVLNVAALLTATGLGFWTKGREQREPGQRADPLNVLLQCA